MKMGSRIYCRGVQLAFRAVQPFLPYRKPLVLRSVWDVPEALKEQGIQRVLIITGPNLHRRGRIDALKSALASNGIDYGVYDDTCSNPTVQNVEEACLLYERGKYQGLIGMGGGSPIDCAKAVGARLVRPKKPIARMKGVLRIRKRIPFLVAIPTTAGTGSEVSIATVISDPEGHDKFPISDFCLIPRVAVLDAENTRTMPPFFVATTGMDALTHAVEAYVGRATTKESRAEALQAVSLIFGNIEASYECPENSEAGQRMLEAAYLAGDAFSRSYVGYVHALAHALGGAYELPHGLCCAILMPYVLEAYGESAHKKLHRLALAAGISSEQEGEKEGARAFILAVRGMNGRMGIPEGISELKAEDIPMLAARAAKEANPLYPVPLLMDDEDLMKILGSVMESKPSSK